MAGTVKPFAKFLTLYAVREIADRLRSDPKKRATARESRELVNTVLHLHAQLQERVPEQIPNQATLFDPRTKARTDDPDTSKAAAAAAAQIIGEHHIRILEALDEGPATYVEIGERADMDRHQVGRRLNELRDAGRVEVTNETRPTPSGRQAQVWRLKASA